MALRAGKRWPAARQVISLRVQAIDAEFGVGIKDVLFQLALARGDTATLGRVRSNRIFRVARQLWGRVPAFQDACLRLTLDIEAMDGHTPSWRNWKPGEEREDANE